jgi:hypothetical protein
MLRRQEAVGRSVGDDDQQQSAVAAGSGGSPPHASPLRLMQPLRLGEALGPLCRGCSRVRRFGGAARSRGFRVGRRQRGRSLTAPSSRSESVDRSSKGDFCRQPTFLLFSGSCAVTRMRPGVRL